MLGHLASLEEAGMTRQEKTVTRLTISLLCGWTLLAIPAFAQGAKPAATPPGVWKSAVPPVKMKGTFDDHDPIGLVAGKLIAADCSLNWTDPDTHKLYCFSSATSLVYFLDSPQTYLAEAEKNWRALQGKPGKAR
jgi:hypothetical protein